MIDVRAAIPKRAAAAFVALATMLIAAPTRAEQPQSITLSTMVSPQYVSGELVGCQLAFEVARHDPEYSQGNFVYLTGNLGFAAFEGKELSIRLKLGVKTLRSDSFEAPSEAYLIDGYETNAPDFISSVPGENGFRIFLYSVGNTTSNAALRQILQRQRFTFAYAMTPGGLNAVVPVDLQIEQINFDAPDKSRVNDKTSKDWSACLSATLKAAKERLEISKVADEAAAAMDRAAAAHTAKR